MATFEADCKHLLKIKKGHHYTVQQLEADWLDRYKIEFINLSKGSLRGYLKDRPWYFRSTQREGVTLVEEGNNIKKRSRDQEEDDELLLEDREGGKWPKIDDN